MAAVEYEDVGEGHFYWRFVIVAVIFTASKFIILFTGLINDTTP